MRYQGTLIEWNAARGFGFVRRHGDADGKVFVHVRAFARRDARPAVGDVVTYAIERDEHGRPRAADVAFAVSSARAAARSPARRTAAPRAGMLRIVVTGVIVIALGAAAWTRYGAHGASIAGAPETPSSTPAARRSAQPFASMPAPPAMSPATSASPPAPAPARVAGPSAAPKPDATGFACSGKRRCSQMTSCAEATFYLRHCPGTITDGDRDGIPCEDQWCGH